MSVRFGRRVCLALLLLAVPAAAQPETLSHKIEAALARLGPHAISAARVVSLDSGKVVYERNAELSLNPASNMKLLTCTTALAKLGPDYRFTTRVLAMGKPTTEGVVEGPLILQGGGDPALETPDLADLADKVTAAGVRQVRGGILADDYRFDAQRLGNGWASGDEPYYYSAEISALSVNRNVLTVEVTPGAHLGDPARVTVKPLEGYVRLLEVPETVAPGSETHLNITRERARNEIRVSGKIAAGAKSTKPEDVTVEEPELYAAALFRKLLADRGITVSGEIRRAKAPDVALVLAEHASLPLSQIAPLLMKPSDNLIAEMLLKELGYTQKHSGDADSGAEVVTGWLKELGIDTGGVRVNDGSGLSRKDLVTAHAVCELVVKANSQPWRQAFLDSLPIGGVDGTLRNRMKGTAAEKNVRAKTGSLSHVSALSGYVTTRSGEHLAFSLITNNYAGPTTGENSMKRVEDSIAVALADQLTR